MGLLIIKRVATFYTVGPHSPRQCHWAMGTIPTIVRIPAVPSTYPHKKEEWKERPLQGASHAPLQTAGESLGPTKAPLFKQRFSLKNFASMFGLTHMKECLK